MDELILKSLLSLVAILLMIIQCYKLDWKLGPLWLYVTVATISYTCGLWLLFTEKEKETETSQKNFDIRLEIGMHLAYLFLGFGLSLRLVSDETNVETFIFTYSAYFICATLIGFIIPRFLFIKE